MNQANQKQEADELGSKSGHELKVTKDQEHDSQASPAKDLADMSEGIGNRNTGSRQMLIDCKTFRAILGQFISSNEEDRAAD